MKASIKAGLLGVAMLGLAVPGVAQAAGSDTGQRPAEHCAVSLESQRQSCFRDYREAKNFAASGGVIIGTFFDDQNFLGESLTVWEQHPCGSGDTVKWVIDFDRLGWKNRISSLQPWANCWIRLYSGPNESGTVAGPYKVNTRYVGSTLDNRAQSASFS